MKKLTLIVMILGIVACQQNKKTELTILHINDTHAKHLPMIKKSKTTGETTTNGGIAEQATLIKQLRSKNTNSLFLHAGDIVTGSVFSLIYKGLESAELNQLLGVDVFTLGNHEFDFGLSNTYAMMADKNYPFLSANIRSYDTGKPITKAYTTTNINDADIAIIGLTSSDNVYTIKDKEGGIIIDEEITSLKKLFSENESLFENDILILLSHVGFEIDKKIAAAFPDQFALIVGGHSHTRLEQPVKVGNTLIIQTENNGTSLGELNATFKGNKIINFNYKLHSIQNIPADPDIQQYITEKKVLVDKELGTPIGISEIYLDDTGLRTGSIPLGNFITDTIFNNFQNLNLDMVLINSGSIRAPLPDGEISIGTFFELHPFDNITVLVEMLGSDLQKVFDHSLSLYDNGGFLQLSKDITASVQDDVVTVTYKGQPLNPNKIYRVLISDWLATGGDGYEIFTTQKQKNLGSDFRDLLIQHVQKHKKITTTEASPEKRWIFS